MKDQLIETCRTALTEGYSKNAKSNASLFAKDVSSDMEKFDKLVKKKSEALLKSIPKDVDKFIAEYSYMGISRLELNWVEETLKLKKWSKIAEKYNALELQDMLHSKIMAEGVARIISELSDWSDTLIDLKTYRK